MKRKITVIALALLLMGSLAYAEEKKFDATVTLTIKGQQFVLTLEEVRELKKLLSNFDPESSSGLGSGGYWLNSYDGRGNITLLDGNSSMTLEDEWAFDYPIIITPN